MENISHNFQYCIMYLKKKLYIDKRDCETSNNLSFTETRVAQD